MPGMDGFETAGHIKQRDRRDTSGPVPHGGGLRPAPGLPRLPGGRGRHIAKPFDPWVLRSKVGVHRSVVGARGWPSDGECARLRTAIEDAVEAAEDGDADAARDRLKSARDG